jgi:hypothetical protein
MTPFSTREKVLTGTIIVLLLLILFLSFKIFDYKIDALAIGGDKYSKPPSMIESIEKASMIFLCKTEIEDKTAKYRISEIVYKDREYEFPYALDDYFPRLQQQVEQGIRCGDGRVVILSSRGPTVFQHLQIMGGTIAGFNGISVEEFILKVKAIKN